MSGWRLALWMTVVMAVIFFLYTVRGILLPFLIGFIVAVLLEPTVKKMRLRGIPRGRAVTSVFLLFFGGVAALLIWCIPIVGGQVASFANSADQLSRKFAQDSYENNYFVRWHPVVRARHGEQQDFIDNALNRVAPTMQRFGLPTSKDAIVEKYIDPRRQDIAKALQGFFSGFLGLLSGVGSQLILLPLVPFVALFLLLDFDKLKANAPRWIPPSIRAQVLDVMGDVGDVFLAYLRGITISWSIYCTILAIILTIMGAPFGILLALLFGTLYLIPFIGSFSSYAILFVVTGLSGQTGNWFVTTDSSWAFAGIVLLSMVIFSETYDKLVHPNLVGHAVGLNPLVSMFVVCCGGTLFGLPGMVVAFPLGGAIKVILERLLKVTSNTNVNLGLPAIPARHRT